MTTRELYEAVLLELRRQKTTSMTPLEFNYYIEKAQIDYVRNRYADFEQYQKNIEDLQSLVVITDGVGTNPLPITSGGDAGKEEFVIPLNYPKKMILLDVLFGVDCNKNDEQAAQGENMIWHNAVIKKHDSKRIANVYLQPNEERGMYYYIQHKDVIRRFGGKTKVNKAVITYIRYPVVPILNSQGEEVVATEFENRINLEIINFVVRIYTEATESQRQQTLDLLNRANFNQVSLNNIK